MNMDDSKDPILDYRRVEPTDFEMQFDALKKCGELEQQIRAVAKGSKIQASETLKDITWKSGNLESRKMKKI